MQIFGKFKEQHELEYLTKCYLYINKNGEDQLSTSDLNLLLKKKNKNVAGTVFLFNPFTVPKGYDRNDKLINQDFEFKDKFYELEDDAAVRIFGKALNKKYKGKLIEIKFLFNYIKEDLQNSSAMDVFDMDLDKLYTNQLTVFSKKHNYHDFKNISYNGKFIFFAWGHKIDKYRTGINTYALNIAQWSLKQGKEIGFIYDGVQDKDDSFEYMRFLHPVAFGKLKQVIPKALEDLFSKDFIEPYCIKDLI